jgi:bifunctional non-homologous end joining protein LigD
MQNRHGQLIVAPFSVRPLPGAPVSMPLTWDGVNDSLDPKDYTIKNAVDRMGRLGADPVPPALNQTADLATVLKRLGDQLAAG